MDDKTPKEVHQKIAKEAIEIAKQKILSEKYNIVILDEINYAVNLELVDVKDVLDLIKIRPQKVTLVLTGNHVKQQIVDVADLVTEMREIKHPFQKGIRAKKGIDF